MSVRIALVFGIVLVLGILVHQIHGWKIGSVLISRRLKFFRVLEAILLIGIMSMIIVGDKSILADHGKLAVIYYWMTCFSLAVVLLVLAMLDIHAVGKHLRERRIANVQELLEDIDEDNGE